MFKVRLENGKYLEVDFKGLLTQKEEEVITYRFAGKSKKAIGQIQGVSPKTICKQNQNAFEKTGVTGTDNPLAALTLFSFQEGFAKFVALFLMILHFGGMLGPRLKPLSRTASSYSRTVRIEHTCSFNLLLPQTRTA